MVYCGKASQGCQSCRTRRIKCDKKRPECSQCIRVGKKCPGYRDQLSLMFRDESSKVIQKAHAQWGNPGSPADSDQESSGPSDRASVSPLTPAPSSRYSSPGSVPSTPTVTTEAQAVTTQRIPRRVEANLDQRGLKFFMERYLLNQPDSPRTPEVMDVYFGGGDAMQNVMIAVGLAGMSNLLGNKSMNLVARSKYVTALKQTGQLIASASTASRDYRQVMKPLKSIVTLALFELVQGKGSRHTAGSANTHIHGAIALLQSVLPVAHAPHGGALGALQLMFSMFIPSQMTETPLPSGFYDCLKLCKQLLHDSRDTCAVDLARAISRLLQLLLAVTQTTFQDDHPETDLVVQQLVLMETVFDRLEHRLQAAYPYTENADAEPGPAVFRGKWHKYGDIWSARVWNHFRWSRILLEETTIKFSQQHPRSSARFISAPHRVQTYAIIERTAEAILVSTPSHWHHPHLPEATARKYEARGEGGTGAAVLASLLWHLKVASCAPNVPPEFWNWVYALLQVVWKSMGMQHAFALLETMEQDRRTALVAVDKEEEESSS